MFPFGPFGNQFPYTNFHELNMDWIIGMMKQVSNKLDDVIVMNSIILSDRTGIHRYTDEEITDLYNNGIRFIVFKNEDNIYDTMYLITKQGNNVTATKYDPAEAQNLNKKRDKYIFIGDSYGTGHGPDANVNSWIYRCANALNLTHELNYWFNAIDGASWAGLNGRASYKEVLQELESSNIRPETITKIVVAGGVNDAAGTLSDLLTGMQTFAEYAKTTYPNAEIYVAEIGWVTNNGRDDIYKVSEKGYGRCGAYGMHYLTNGNLIMHQYDNFQSDGVHPNNAGASALGWAMASALNGGSFAFNTEYTFYYTPNASIFSTERNWNINENISNGQIVIAPHFSGNMFFQDNAPLVSATKYKLADEQSNQKGYVQSLNDTDGALLMDALLTYNDGTTHQYIIKVLITFEGKSIYFTPIFSPFTVPDSAVKSLQFLYSTSYVIPHMYF